MIKSKRIQWLDFARGLTIFLVVFAHGCGKLSTLPIYSHTFVLPLLTFILFTFIMPCFFAISGYLYKPVHNIHSYVLMIYKKIISLGIPYIIFSIVYVIMQNSAGSSNTTYFHSYKSLLYIYITPIDYLWFLYALFLMFMIIGLFDLIRLSHLIQFIMCLLLMSISIVFPHLLPLGLEYTFNDIIYFYFGFLLSNVNITDIKIFKLKYVTIIFILSLIVRLLINDLSTNSTFTNFISRILGIVLLVQASKTIRHNKIFHYFDKYGKCTLIIYLVHAPVISIVRDILLKLISINILNVILLSLALTIIAWLVSIFICYLSKRVKIVNFIFYPRKKYISKLLVQTKFGKWLFC